MVSLLLLKRHKERWMMANLINRLQRCVAPYEPMLEALSPQF